jgi:CBS domain-containing protein
MNAPIWKVLELKGKTVESIPPSTMVLAAVARMNERHIGALLVTDGGRPVGIFTERDILVRVVARGVDPKATPVSEVMTRHLITIRSDATVTDAMRVITHERCRHLPVIDDHELRGMVSIGDLTSWVVRDHQRTIEDLEDYIRR